MADTFVSTNYNGELNDFVYKVLGLAFQTAQKGGYHLLTGVNMKEEVDYLETSEDPMIAYTDDTPTAGATSTTLKKRELNPLKSTVWGTMTPSVWLPIWRKWRSVGTLTQLSANAEFLRDVFELVGNATARQIDKCFWQGDTASVTPALTRFDGLHKKIEADSDGNVIFITPAGAITQINVVAIIQSVYSAIPTKFFDDPDFRIMMNTGDFKLLQYFNNDAKKTTVGVLDESINRMFLEKRIEHFEHIKASHIVGAKTTMAESSNFILGMYASPEAEMGGIKVEKKEISNITQYRFDLMADTQYRYGGDIVYYKPV